MKFKVECSRTVVDPKPRIHEVLAHVCKQQSQ